MDGKMNLNDKMNSILEIVKTMDNDEILEFCDPRIQLIKNSVEEMFGVEFKDHSLYFFGTKKKK